MVFIRAKTGNRSPRRDSLVAVSAEVQYENELNRQVPFLSRPQQVRNWRVDACGFQTFRFECSQCRGAVSGIIDPFGNIPLTSDARS